MRTLNYTAAREKLAATMDEVIADHAPVIITRSGSPSVVMLSLDDYESMQETTYLLSNPANARRLLDSIQALEGGSGIIRDTADLLGP